MGYMHIENLSRNQTLLLFKKVYALEKIHGTSAHISLKRKEVGQALDGTFDGPVQVEAQVGFFSGGEKYERFVSLFNQEELKAKFLASGRTKCIIYGEAYGGKMQGMKDTYGDKLKFVAFDVKMAEQDEDEGLWLGVEAADLLVTSLGLEFVAWNLVDTDLASLDRERDLPSRQAVRNGITEPKIAEGVVLRPPIEVRTNNGGRLISKYKRPEFSERASKKDTTVSPDKQEVLDKAEAIAAEWVTEGRLEHVLDKLKATLGRPILISDTRTVIVAMVEDVTREAKGEIVESKEANSAIGNSTAKLLKKWLHTQFEKTVTA